MQRCINHNDRLTTYFCVNCGKYICDECRREFSGKNFCKECHVKPILKYYQEKLPPSKPIHRKTDVGCIEGVIRGFLVFLGICVLSLLVIALLLSDLRDSEIDVRRVYFIFAIGLVLIFLGAINFKKLLNK